MPGEREDSVFLVEWYTGLARLSGEETMGRTFWGQLQTVRDAVNKEMEARRGAGDLRGSLDAEVTLYCAPDLLAQLESLGDELRFVLITSDAVLSALDDAPDTAAATELDGLRLEVRVSTNEKCERCWHRRADVGATAAHATLCSRCVTNVEGEGEQRSFA